MCIHSWDDEKRCQQKIEQEIRSATTQELKEKLSAMAPVRFLYVKGRRYGQGLFVDVRDEQEIADAIRDLGEWHGTTDKVLDMSAVQDKRAKLGLAPLDLEKIPLPKGVARKSLDVEERVQVA